MQINRLACALCSLLYAFVLLFHFSFIFIESHRYGAPFVWFFIKFSGMDFHWIHIAVIGTSDLNVTHNEAKCTNRKRKPIFFLFSISTSTLVQYNKIFLFLLSIVCVCVLSFLENVLSVQRSVFTNKLHGKRRHLHDSDVQRITNYVWQFKTTIETENAIMQP